MRSVPHPLLSVAVTLGWLVLTGFTAGQLVLGVAVGLLAGLSYAALTPPPIRLRRPGVMARLFVVVAADIVQSNFNVARLILNNGRNGTRRSGFVRIPLELEQNAALAVLSIIITATPGTLWIDYDPDSRIMLIHVFDLTDEQAMIDSIKSRYEAPLLEIFA